MRCPQCGTQNEPDSRFCGGCGARLSGTLAPTQKISPDAQFTPGPVQPQPTTLQRQPPPPNSASQPVARAPSGQQPPLNRPSSPPQPVQQRQPSAQVVQQRQPSAPQPVARASQPSVPPIGQRGPRAQSVPPSNGVPANVRPARGSLAEASLSMAPARGRPWGVIIVVLVIDLALAAAGGWLLSQGLADPPAPAPGSAAKTGSTSGEGKAIGTIAPAAALPAARVAPVPPKPANPSTLMPVTTPEPAAAPPKPKARKRPSVGKKKSAGPIDPYNEPAPGPPLPPYPPPPPLPEPSP